MAIIKLTVRQIVNLGLWDKVCDYRGWDQWSFREDLKTREDERIDFDDEFKKETKCRNEYNEYIEDVSRIAKEGYKLAKGKHELEEIIDSLTSIAESGIKHEIIVRELEEYLETNEHRKDFDEIREITGRGLNLNFPEDY